MQLKHFFVLLFVLFCCSIAFAEDTVDGNVVITVSGSESFVPGDGNPITINILVENKSDVLAVGYFAKYFGDDDIPVDPPEFLRHENIPLATLPYLFFLFQLQPYESKEFSYTIIPEAYLGDEPVEFTNVVTNLGYVNSNKWVVKAICNDNSICERDLGEFSYNCPHDCNVIGDGACTTHEDGICDPDCNLEFRTRNDPDCEGYVPICNHNNICEPFLEEHGWNCPDDCNIVGDEDCITITDGVCDTDCVIEMQIYDEDCNYVPVDWTFRGNSSVIDDGSCTPYADGFCDIECALEPPGYQDPDCNTSLDSNSTPPAPVVPNDQNHQTNKPNNASDSFLTDILIVIILLSALLYLIFLRKN